MEKLCEDHLAIARRFGKPLLCTETCAGSFDDQERGALARDGLETLERHGIGWIAWQLCSGPFVSGSREKVAFAAPFPGNILPIRLSDVGGRLICQKDSFLAAAKGVSIGLFFQRRILTGLFGGEGFIMQRLTGPGLVFVEVDGEVVEYELKQGQLLKVDTGHIAAYEPTVDFDVVMMKGLGNLLLGGEGLLRSAVEQEAILENIGQVHRRHAGHEDEAVGPDRRRDRHVGGDQPLADAGNLQGLLVCHQCSPLIVADSDSIDRNIASPITAATAATANPA